MKNKENIYISNSKDETWEIAKKILDELGGNNVILLKGELGSGKTTFSQGVLKSLGAKGPFTSPTFVIMKKYDVESRINPSADEVGNHESVDLNSTSYKLPATNCVYHLDCYRVGAKDVLDLGWEEIINNKNNLVLVEWPEKIESILPEKYLKLEFEILGEDKRKIKMLKS